MTTSQKKRALIFGITGQDGSFMAEFLKEKGYEVYGLVRVNSSEEKIAALSKLVPSAKVYQCRLTDKKEVYDYINQIRPDEIYNFAGISNTFTPYENTDELIDVNLTVVLNILESIVKVHKNNDNHTNTNSYRIKFFQASSALAIDKTYPYGIIKSTADDFVKLYRDKFNLFACSGILYPHESERRGEYFFTKKVCSAVARIKNGSDEKLHLGDLNGLRDWSFAGDVVRCAHLMLQQDYPKDAVICNSKLTSQKEFVDMAFKSVGLNYNDHVIYSEFHETNIMPLPPHNIWKIVTMSNLEKLIKRMIDFEMKKLTPTPTI